MGIFENEERRSRKRKRRGTVNRLGQRVLTLFALGGLTVGLAGCPAFVNQPPVAIADASPTSGEAPLTVQFDGSASYDPDGTIASFEWDFDGDGTPDATTQTASYEFTAEGTYLVVLTVTDNLGKRDSDALVITVGSSSIYFASDRTMDLEIFRMDTDGSNPAQVTDTLGPDMFPALAPNGRDRLAFSSVRSTLGNCPDCSFDLFISEPDGTLPINLTPTQTMSHEVQPSWSPDRTQIVFASDKDHLGTAYGLYLYDLSTNQMTALFVEAGSHALAPAWSPDGEWIAFASDRDGDFEVYKIRPDGTGLTQLTTDAGADGFRGDFLDTFGGLFANPAPIFRGGISWSPDGTKIVFASDRNGNFDLFTINADGTGLAQVTTHSGNDFSPFWLPGGEIAFVSDRDGDLQIYKLNPDTLAVTGPLTTVGFFNVQPASLRGSDRGP